VFQAGLRSLAAFFPVLAYTLITRKRLSISDGSLIPGLLCGLFFALEFLLLFESLEFTSVSRASVMFYTMPFWVALAAHFLIPGDRLTLTRLAGLVLAFIGVAWALLHNAAPASPYALYGDLLCLVGAMLWAGVALLARATRLRNAVPEMQLLYQLAVSSVVLICASPLFGDPIRHLTPTIGAIFAFQVLVIVCFGFLTWFRVLSIYPASDVASFGFLAPVFGVFFSWVVLGEHISYGFLGAMALVCVGIVLVNRRPK
jgi:drug/metabolite transporter (DMT)-like permease